MSLAVIPVAIAAFLSGAVTAVFALLVAGIHAGDRPGHLAASPPRGQLESLTRTIVGVGIRADDEAEG